MCVRVSVVVEALSSVTGKETELNYVLAQCKHSVPTPAGSTRFKLMSETRSACHVCACMCKSPH